MQKKIYINIGVMTEFIIKYTDKDGQTKNNQKF